MKPAALADLLRDCLSSGAPPPLAEAYADDAVLDISLPGGRRKLIGPDAIVAALGACFAGPGRLVEWTPAVHPEGVAVWLERVGDDGEAIRQRHYLRLRDGRVERHWLYAARPHTCAGGLDPRLGRAAVRGAGADRRAHDPRLQRLVWQPARPARAARRARPDR